MNENVDQQEPNTYPYLPYVAKASDKKNITLFDTVKKEGQSLSTKKYPKLHIKRIYELNP